MNFSQVKQRSESYILSAFKFVLHCWGLSSLKWGKDVCMKVFACFCCKD